MVPTARGSEKRCATATLLTALTTGLAGVREPRLARERFEEELRAFVSASSVTFCEDGDPPDRPNVVSCAIPAPAVDGRPRLEAVFHPSRPADDRARLMVEAAAQVAGLLLGIERASGRWPVTAPRSSDRAAPLIGSSVPIRIVRDRIQKVAATDFTVLIEGPSRR